MIEESICAGYGIELAPLVAGMAVSAAVGALDQTVGAFPICKLPIDVFMACYAQPVLRHFKRFVTQLALIFKVGMRFETPERDPHPLKRAQVTWAERHPATRPQAQAHSNEQ
jgi:hypothetical protein